MGRPRFRPAALFANPRDFGRNASAKPLGVTALSETERAWAWYQHRAAVAVRKALASDKSNPDQFAKQLGEDPDWLSRKLNGQAPADLGEILTWARLLGVDIVPKVESPQDVGL
jgi:hypothetical protein